MKKNITYFFHLFSFIFLFSSAKAQINYLPGGFTTSASTYVDLGTNGDTIAVANKDDAFSLPLPIGFTFNFNGSPSDSFTFSTNGFIKLGRDTASRHFLFTTHAQPPANGPFTAATSPTPLAKDSSMIFAFGQDLFPGTNASEFRYYTSGLPGSQVCTIQWKNVKDKFQATVAGQWDTINFQIKLYESTNVVQIVYGKWTASTPVNFARFSAVGLVGNSMTVANQNMHLVKGSTVAWSGSVANTGFYLNNAVNYRSPVSTPAGPAPDLGRTYTFTPLTLNDASVRAVYAQGRVALPFYFPDSIRANISNTGLNPITSLTVTLNISGTNTYTATASITGLAPNGNVNVSFPPFYPTNTGANLITISVPNDDNNANNSRTYSMSISNSRMGYTDTLVASSGGNGTTIPHFWGAKYFVANSGIVTQVRTPLAANSEALGDTVCGMILDTFGNILARSPNYVVQASDLGSNLTFNLSAPILVTNQSIIAGIAGGQTVTGLNYFLGTSQTEVPFRPNTTFYFMSQIIGGGISNAIVGLNYAAPVGWATTRLMMECTLMPIPPIDVGISASGPIQQVKLPVSVNIPLRAVVKNTGTQARTSGIQVRYSINNGPIIGPVSTTVGITPNDTTSVLFSGVNGMTFPSTGFYTVKIYTSLAGDGFTSNDTLTVLYEAVPNNVLPYRIANNILSAWTSRGNTPALWKEKTAIQSNGLSNTNVLYADNIITNQREAFMFSPPISLVGNANPIMHFNVAHAPNTFANTDDTLQVMISNNGGLTFVPLYTKSSQLSTPTLGTDTPTSGSYTPNFATDWRLESVNLSAFAGSPYVVIAIRDRSASGNGIYIGNIHVSNASAPLSVQSVSSTGTYSSGNMSIIFNSIGSSSGEIAFARYNAAPFSGAVPVFASNTTAATNNTSIFTPNNVSQSQWYAVTYSGMGTGNYFNTIQYSINFDLTGISGVFSKDSLYLMRRTDVYGSWVPVTTYVSGNNLYTGLISGISDFTIGSLSSINPLPVNWLSFEANNVDPLTNQLSWATSSEINSSMYVIERSFNNQIFDEIGQVKAAGNSNKKIVYTFKDALDQAFEKSMQYRIKQIDLDGSFSYSKVITLSPLSSLDQPEIKVSNPFESSPIVWVKNMPSSPISLLITDMSGKVVLSKTIQTQAGQATLDLEEMEMMQSGIYLVELTCEGSKLAQQKIIKSK